MYFALKDQPVRKPDAPSSEWRGLFFVLVQNPQFDLAAIGLVLLNLLVLMTRHFDQSEGWTSFQIRADAFFIVLYSAEILIRVIGSQIGAYFSSALNTADFLLIVGSLISLSLGGDPGAFAVVRAGRVVVKTLQMVRHSARMQRVRLVLAVTINSLPAVANVGSLLFLLLVVFSILGSFMFWNVAHGDYINKHANFSDFGTSFMTLFRILTGEMWPGLLFDSRQGTCEDPVADQDTGCGGPVQVLLPIVSRSCRDSDLMPVAPAWQAHLFYFSFIMLSSHTLLNLFVAVILEQFEAVRRIETNPLKPGRFGAIWKEFDTETLLLIPFVSLEPFMVPCQSSIPGYHASLVHLAIIPV